MTRISLADTVLVIAAVALLAWACARIDNESAMTKCQERHSFSTCHAALNR